MTRTYDGSIPSVRAQLQAEDDEDDESIFELGDICTPAVRGNVEPILALGSDIHALDGTPLCSTARAETLDELDAVLVAYLIDREK